MADEFYKLRLVGHVPSKKNLYRRKRGGGMYKTRETNALLVPLLLQIKAAWKRPPLKRASIHTIFYVQDGRSDLDNKFQAIQDLLVSGGVLENDSIARVRHISARAVVVTDEEAVDVILTKE